MKKLFLFSAALCVFFVAVYLAMLRPVDSTDTKAQAVKIEPGSSIKAIGKNLHERGLIRSVFAFKIYSRLTGASTRLQAGSFALSPSQSAGEIIDILRSGKTEEFNVTIPEGYTIADLDKLMASKGLGAQGDIINCAFTCDFATFDFLPAPTPSSAKATEGRPGPSPAHSTGSGQAGGGEKLIGSRLEGYVFPETYSVSSVDYDPKFFLERMLGTFRTRIVNAYAEDIKKSGRTLDELVTMASLVEEESRHDDERAIIAGILWKRLKNKIVLGVDATTRYVLKKRTEPLTKQDTEFGSPYNTRRSQGLPPTPIASPGESSFVAALKPEESPYWYYLHGMDGVIHYAVTNDEHNANKAKYLR